MTSELVSRNSHQALEGSSLPQEWYLEKSKGKVRDIYELSDGKLIIVATDRLSAFDRQVGVVPNRGQVLNQLSKWWFEKTADIVPNHMIDVPHPNVMIVKKCEMIPVEMVVRGYLTGSTDTSVWKRYELGWREFGGFTLRDGMRKNERLPQPVLDPTSKAIEGHDQNLTREEIIGSGVVTPEIFGKMEEVSFALFERGQELARAAGLILVDTKYEFGIDPRTGEIVLIDEIHTPDSSRFWRLFDYEERLRDGLHPEIYDKEFARLWLVGQGYRGVGESPAIPWEVIDELRARYIYAYEKLTGHKFMVPEGDVNARIVKNVGLWLERR